MGPVLSAPAAPAAATDSVWSFRQLLLITELILEGLQSWRNKRHFRKGGRGEIGKSNCFLKDYLVLKLYLLLIILCSVIPLIDSCLKAVRKVLWGHGGSLLSVLFLCKAFKSFWLSKTQFLQEMQVNDTDHFTFSIPQIIQPPS